MSDPDVLSVGTTTHGRVLVRRAATQPPRGTVAGFHGYMESAATHLARLEQIPGAEEWTLVSIQALHRFYRGRSQEVVASWMTREDRETAIADNVRYVDAAIAAVSGSASGPVIYLGFSQGVAMAFRAAAHAERPAAGVVAIGGDVPPELLADSTRVFPPVFLARGATDDWYTGPQLTADVTALKTRGVDVHELVYEGGHEWTAAIAQAVADWLHSSI